ncbi:L-ascorbate oxidase [Moorena producens PAL-8-15-08-1]|uniref:L-ascorbate oxidase n=1 Tax=Moorena producens PAL-8-15-08-1 TaxID=1458985 RepID=A0A1D8U3D9_9CYAN|nr:L-ascorbate oxidase [Moorena producens PAL-8-15-08-1]
MFGEGGDRFWVTCRNIIVGFFISAQITMLAAQPAQAEPAERSFQNPPLLQFRETIAPLTLKEATTTGSLKEFDFNIQYTESQLFNPATMAYDQVRLRSYVGTDTNPNRPYVAPTIEARPGDTIRVNLNNQLGDDPSCPDSIEDVNEPHCFNDTNLHTHGFWVSPKGNSDNVLVKIKPGDEIFPYEYELPEDHPAGTFWYHPHVHGSTALQVSSGMAGALIVRGDRLPTETANGDIDTLLKGPYGRKMPEKILVFQQIPYYCPKSEGSEDIWNCDSDETGVIETYDYEVGTGNPEDDISIFGPGTWVESGRYTSINGQILPFFLARAGKIQRWRMIHAGVRDTISLEFRKLQYDEFSIKEFAATGADGYIGQNCTGDPIPYHVIADDGLTRKQAWETTLTTLQPGYRNDALVLFPQKGLYCVIDTAAEAPTNVSREATSRQLLGIVAVSGGNSIAPDQIHQYLIDRLVARAAVNIPEGSIREEVIDDLNNDLMLTKFIDHPDIDYSEVTGYQELAFNIDTSATPTEFQVSNGIGINEPYDPQPYDPDRMDRTLTLGTVDEWTLESRFVGHPFHIHVNPFQIIAIYDPNGNDVSLPDATDGGDPEYPGLKGVWKDTLWIKGPSPGSTYPEGVYRIVVRTRYQRYPGIFVLHCHILDHEDQGMMQNICINDPSTAESDDCQL